MNEFNELIEKLKNATRGNFVLSDKQRKILLEGIKVLQQK